MAVNEARVRQQELLAARLEHARIQVSTRETSAREEENLPGSTRTRYVPFLSRRSLTGTHLDAGMFEASCQQLFRAELEVAQRNASAEQKAAEEQHAMSWKS